VRAEAVVEGVGYGEADAEDCAERGFQVSWKDADPETPRKYEAPIPANPGVVERTYVSTVVEYVVF
jgi:hypothetical protein